MALKKLGFIVTGAQLDPAKHRSTLETPVFTLITVGITRPEQGIAVAKELVAEGIELLELCGGFGPVWTGKVIEAIEGKIPVGSVAYGPESIDQMYALFK